MPPAIITFYTESCLWHVGYGTVTLYLRGFFLHRMISGHLRKLTEMKKLGLFFFNQVLLPTALVMTFICFRENIQHFLTHNVPLSSLVLLFLSLLDSCPDLDLANQLTSDVNINSFLKYTVRTYLPCTFF